MQLDVVVFCLHFLVLIIDVKPSKWSLLEKKDKIWKQSIPTSQWSPFIPSFISPFRVHPFYLFHEGHLPTSHPAVLVLFFVAGRRPASNLLDFFCYNWPIAWCDDAVGLKRPIYINSILSFLPPSDDIYNKKDKKASLLSEEVDNWGHEVKTRKHQGLN